MKNRVGLLFRFLCTVTCFAYALSSSDAQDIAISEIRADTGLTATIEITNYDNLFAEDISTYWLWNFPTRVQLLDTSSITVLCGNLDLGPGESVTITGFATTDPQGGEMALFRTNDFSDVNSIVDYVLWGDNVNEQVTDIAVEAGIWTANDAVNSFSEGWSIQYDGSGDASADWIVTTLPSICMEVMCNVDGGQVSYGGELNICGGGSVLDVLDIGLEGEVGDGSAFIVTDQSNNIVAIDADSSIQYSEVPIGNSLIWHLSYDPNQFSGLEVGNNLNTDLVGCFSLSSNSIPIFKLEVEGGELVTDDDTIICAGEKIRDFVFPVAVNASGLSRIVITDTNAVVIGLPNNFPLAFETFEEGYYELWNISFAGDLVGLDTGANITTDLSGCYDLSNSISVIRLTPYGGTLSVNGQKEACLNESNENAFFVHVDSAVGINEVWAITDTADIVLDVQTQLPLDLSNIANDEIFIWHITYMDSINDLGVGVGIRSLSSCSGLSDSIYLVRSDLEGGQITTDQELIACNGASFPDTVWANVSSANGELRAWLLTTDSMEIIAIQDTGLFAIDSSLGLGAFNIIHMSYDEGLTGLEPGTSVDELIGCYALSNKLEFIQSNPDGGQLSFVPGVDTSICLIDDDSISLRYILEGREGSSSAFVFTDEEGRILEINETAIEIGSSLSGSVLLRHISYESNLVGLEIGNDVKDSLSGCFDLSNALRLNVYHLSPGVIAASDTSLCADDGEEVLYPVEVSNAVGDTGLWIVTDIDDVIQVTSDSAAFVINDAFPRSYKLWYASFGLNSGTEFISGDVLGVDQEGCYVLTEPVTVSLDTSGTGSCVVTSVANTFEENVQVQVYPNPFSDQLNIDISDLNTVLRGKNAFVSVYDVAGRVVYQEQRRISYAEENIRLNSHNWPKGSFILRISTSEGTYATTLIKTY